MKIVKEDISKILARPKITESTQWLWLSVKKKKYLLLFSVKSTIGILVLKLTVYGIKINSVVNSLMKVSFPLMISDNSMKESLMIVTKLKPSNYLLTKKFYLL